MKRIVTALLIAATFTFGAAIVTPAAQAQPVVVTTVAAVPTPIHAFTLPPSLPVAVTSDSGPVTLYNVPLGTWVNFVKGTCWEKAREDNFGAFGWAQEQYVAGTCASPPEVQVQVDFYNGAYHQYGYTPSCYDGAYVAGCTIQTVDGYRTPTTTNSPQPNVSGYVIRTAVHVCDASSCYVNFFTWASS